MLGIDNIMIKERKYFIIGLFVLSIDFAFLFNLSQTFPDCFYGLLKTIKDIDEISSLRKIEKPPVNPVNDIDWKKARIS